MRENFARLEIKGKNIFLNGIRVKGVEKFKATLSSDLPEGKAELEMKAIVECLDNKQGQNLSQVGKESE